MPSGTCVPANLTAVVLPPIWGWDGWFIIAVLAVMFFVIVKDWVRVEFAMLLSMTVMVAALTPSKVLTVDTAYVGFSNSGVLTVTVLFVVAEGLSATGALDYLMNKMMGNPKTVGMAIVRMTFPHGVISAFTNNTPQVALMIPILQIWARKINIAPSLVMMPISYASILGGTLTLLGTSTNLVVSGRAYTQYCRQMGLFDIGLVGVPTMFVGLTYMLLFTEYLLPGKAEYLRRVQMAAFVKNMQNGIDINRAEKPGCFKRLSRKISRAFRNLLDKRSPKGKDVIEEDDDESTISFENGGAKKPYDGEPGYKPDAEFVLHGVVKNDPIINGKSVADAGLRSVAFFLIIVQRGNVVYNAVGPEFVLQEDDIVSFTGGEPNEFIAFARSKGIEPISVIDENGEVRIESIVPNPSQVKATQAVVRADSSLVGKTAKEADFRNIYKSSIIAISRPGEKLINSRLGKIVFKIGDVLLIVPSDAFSWTDPIIAADLKLRNEQNFLEPIEDLRVDREFIIPMRVNRSSPLWILPGVHRRTIGKSGVKDVPGVALIAINRGDELIGDPDDNYVLLEGDILWFVGDRDSVSGLRRVPGLVDAAKPHLDRIAIPPHHRRLVEVVVSHRADFVGSTVRESRFRTHYGAVIVSVLRLDFQHLRKLGDYVIKGGDVLIIDAGPDFARFFKDNRNFALISEVPNSTPPRWESFYVAFTVMVAMFALESVLSSVNMSVNLVVLGTFAAAIMLFCGVLSGDRAHKSVDWGVIITVASAFGMSTALEKSYIAGIVGNAFVSLAVMTNTGVAGLVFTILLSTMLFSSLINNNAAALLMFPIAAQAVYTMKVDPMPILFALMLGASDYATPFGYQTNQMVMIPGCYYPIDYLRYGIPLMILLLITETIFLATLDYWYICWLVTIGAYIAAIIFDISVRGGTPIREIFPTFQDVKKWGGKNHPKALLNKMVDSGRSLSTSFAFRSQQPLDKV